MTDNEIIKALECCGSNDPCGEECFGHDMNGIAACTKILAQNALDLINRQKAEIERLEAMIDAAEEHFAPLPFKNKFDEYIEKAKAEAIKEFAERFNKEAEKVSIDREGDFVEANNEIYYTVADWCKKTSDNIVKEMVGEDNA